jgi:predicted transcriptional regulator with HTH domain
MADLETVLKGVEIGAFDSKKLSHDMKDKLLALCDRSAPFHGVIAEALVIVVLIHYLYIISNAERAMDLVEVSEQCSADNISKVKTAAAGLRTCGYIGVAACVLMLVLSRYIESMGEKVYRAANIALGVLNLSLFIAVLALAGQITSESGKCAGAATGVHAKALGELKQAATGATTWGAIGLVASIGYAGFHTYKIVYHQ